jgi:hypothetical protein
MAPACRSCGEPRPEGVLLSWSGLCVECGEWRAVENFRGMISHSGPAFEAWRRAMARSVGATLPDELGEPG